MNVSEACRRLSERPGFHQAVLAIIVVNALVMGLATWPSLNGEWGWLFHAVNLAVQALFVVEIVVRIAAHGRRPLAFFRDGWNVFDFAVVVLSLLPAAGSLATISRLARVLRVGRLVTGMPELRLIIGTMLRSIRSMGHVVMLLGILVYVYGVVGHHLFGRVDPEHWGTLGRAAHTLFLVITLEGWIELMQESEAATPWAWLYYFSFIVVGVFVVINLFIAVVINNLEKARDEAAAEVEGSAHTVIAVELKALGARMDELAHALHAREHPPAADGGARSAPTGAEVG